MDELFRKLGALESFNLWGDSTSSDETSFEVTEAWLDHATGKVEHRFLSIGSDNMMGWLAEDTLDKDDAARSLVLRLVWVDVDVINRKILLAGSVLELLLRAFGLEMAHAYAKSCLTNVSAIPQSKKQPGRRAYSFCYVPKIASVWSHRRFDIKAETSTDRPHVTQAIAFVPQKERKALLKFLATSWNAHLYRSAMFLPFLFSLFLLAGIQKTEVLMAKRIPEIEGLTGHHKFGSVVGDEAEAATAELGKLSAEVSGCATKLASAARKSKMVDNLLDFIVSDLDKDDGAEGDCRRFLTNHVEHLKNRLAMLNVDMEYTQKRVQVQISALASLISQSDSLASIKLALHSYRDSSSMKTLAIVTMFFLPGSFVSAIFSTQLFDWDSVDPKSHGIGLKTNPQFVLYWIITILLTLTTFALYFLWLWLQKRRKTWHDPSREPSLLEPDRILQSEKGLGQGDEFRAALTAKRTMMKLNSMSDLV